MGCKYACTCGGACWSCSMTKRESYFGEAEDNLARQIGYRSFADHMSQQEPCQEDPRCQEGPEPDHAEIIKGVLENEKS